MATGQVGSVVEDVIPLSHATEALERSRGGRTRGKLVLEVRPPD
jgi:NADPH:quinone reductase-like Zn-dependent oxidoreductase